MRRSGNKDAEVTANGMLVPFTEMGSRGARPGHAEGQERPRRTREDGQ